MKALPVAYFVTFFCGLFAVMLTFGTLGFGAPGILVTLGWWFSLRCMERATDQDLRGLVVRRDR